MVNNRSLPTAKNMSLRLCLKVTKFHSTSFRAMEEIQVIEGGGGGGGTGLIQACSKKIYKPSNHKLQAGSWLKKNFEPRSGQECSSGEF